MNFKVPFEGALCDVCLGAFVQSLSSMSSKVEIEAGICVECLGTCGTFVPSLSCMSFKVQQIEHAIHGTFVWSCNDNTYTF